MDVCIIPGGMHTCMYCSVFITTTNCVLMNIVYMSSMKFTCHVHVPSDHRTVVTSHVTVYQSRPCVTFDGAKS